MCAGGTKVLLGWEMASRGNLAARVLVLLALEADLARREVRLRVGAMVVVLYVGWGRVLVVVVVLFSFIGLRIIWRFGGAEAAKVACKIPDEKQAYLHFILQPFSHFAFLGIEITCHAIPASH